VVDVTTVVSDLSLSESLLSAEEDPPLLDEDLLRLRDLRERRWWFETERELSTNQGPYPRSPPSPPPHQGPHRGSNQSPPTRALTRGPTNILPPRPLPSKALA
jgi:hypothetical protein